MIINYRPSNISFTIHAPVQCFQNVLAYLVTDVSYSRKMFMKLTTDLLKPFYKICVVH